MGSDCIITDHCLSFDFKCFTIYGHGGHLGHMTRTICINSFPSPIEAPYEI